MDLKYSEISKHDQKVKDLEVVVKEQQEQINILSDEKYEVNLLKEKISLLEDYKQLYTDIKIENGKIEGKIFQNLLKIQFYKKSYDDCQNEKDELLNKINEIEQN